MVVNNYLIGRYFKCYPEKIFYPFVDNMIIHRYEICDSYIGVIFVDKKRHHFGITERILIPEYLSWSRNNKINELIND